MAIISFFTAKHQSSQITDTSTTTKSCFYKQYQPYCCFLMQYKSLHSNSWMKQTALAHLSLANSQRGSSGRSYSGIGSSCAELRRVVMRTSGVLEFMEELESADTYRRKEIGWSPQSGFIWQIKLQGITRGVQVYPCMCDWVWCFYWSNIGHVLNFHYCRVSLVWILYFSGY